MSLGDANKGPMLLGLSRERALDYFITTTLWNKSTHNCSLITIFLMVIREKSFANFIHSSVIIDTNSFESQRV